jgi:hypothetical protein
VGQSARSAQSRQSTWRFRVVNTESRLETERLPEATFVAPLRIWEVEPDFAWCSFVRIHRMLRVTPAMAAGITDHVWEMEELLR